MSLVQLILLLELLFLVVAITLGLATTVWVNNNIQEQFLNGVLAIADPYLKNLGKTLIETEHLGMSQLLLLPSLLATSQSKIFVPHKSQKQQHSVESTSHLLTHYLKTFQELKKPLDAISQSLKTMSTTFLKLNTAVTGNVRNLLLNDKSMRRNCPPQQNMQDLMILNTHGLSQTSSIQSPYHLPSLLYLISSNYMQLILRALSIPLSTCPHVLNSLTPNGQIFLPVMQSTLIWYLQVITWHPTMMSTLSWLAILTSSLEPLLQPKLFQVLGNGWSLGTGLLGWYQWPSLIMQVNWLIMLSTSLDFLQQLISFSTTKLSFLTRLSAVVLAANMILSSLISTNSLTLELHTWIQLAQQLYSAHLSQRYPQLHARNRRHATNGTRGCACLMAASAVNSMFVTSAQRVATKHLIACPQWYWSEYVSTTHLFWQYALSPPLSTPLITYAGGN